MEAYTDFAYLYDIFMEDVPYEKWADLLSSLFKAYGENINNVLDLGCGTGTLTELLADKGYTMTGVDISADMLTVASAKAYESEHDILYINQDMCELSLMESQDAIISVCDSVNYLITDEDMRGAFGHIYDSLRKDGLFIFDFNTIYKYETVIGDTTIAENREDCSFIWENYYNSTDNINEYDVTFFRRVSDEEELFERFCETHVQRGYTLEQMKNFAKEAGFVFVTALDEETTKSPTEKSERIYVVLRK